MAERDVGCLPVVNGTGDLVAILTRSDIVESLAAASDDEDLFA
jgi:CBS domain-containing protein